MKKQTVEKLDEANLLWLLKQISLGNLMRGINWVVQVLQPVKKCVVSTATRIKKSIEEAGEEEEQPKKRRKKSRSLGKPGIEGIEKAT